MSHGFAFGCHAGVALLRPWEIGARTGYQFFVVLPESNIAAALIPSSRYFRWRLEYGAPAPVRAAIAGSRRKAATAELKGQPLRRPFPPATDISFSQADADCQDQVDTFRT